MSEPKVYATCDTNCKYETFTKAQFIAYLQQAIESGSLAGIDPNMPLGSKLKEINSNTGIEFWFGTQAEYNALETKADNTIYVLTDDTTLDDLNAAIAELQSATTSNTSAIAASLAEINKIKDGTTIVSKANESAYSTRFTKYSWENADSSPNNKYVIGTTYEIYYEFENGYSTFGKYLIFSIPPSGTNVIYLKDTIYDYGTSNIIRGSVLLRKQSDGTYALEISEVTPTKIMRRVVGAN